MYNTYLNQNNSQEGLANFMARQNNNDEQLQNMNLQTEEVEILGGTVSNTEPKDEIAVLADFAGDGNKNDSATEEITETEAEPLTRTPYIPDTVFEKLPTILSAGCGFFDKKRERDVFLTTALSVLSGCFHTVRGCYDSKTVYPNLYSFVVAPAANGKSTLVFAKQLGLKIHTALVAESIEKQKQYQQALKIYNAAKKGKSNATTTAPPVEPPFKVLYIPGDASSAKVISHLVSNGEVGIFCETEADAMGNAFKQDWGGYSDKLRKAFHHETISFSRKTGSEYQEVLFPRLSVVLSGTPDQVCNIIQSAEDGLFSRFMFYTFKEKADWKDVSPIGKVNLTDSFNSLAEAVAAMAQQVNRKKITFNLTQEQWDQLNKVFSRWLLEVNTLVSEDASSAIKRLGLILYRIAMTLSILRYADKDKSADNFFEEEEFQLICEDTDFESAMALVQVYKEHSMMMFSKLPKSAPAIDQFKKKFYEALPEEFKREEAIKTGLRFSKAERTVDGYLNQFVKYKLLDKPNGDGFYKKVA